MAAPEISLKRLQNNCTIAWDRYADMARATCEMVSTLRKLPISYDRRLAIYLQQKREDEALAEYQKASHALLRALEIHPDLLESAASSLPITHSRAARHSTGRQAAGDRPKTGT